MENVKQDASIGTNILRVSASDEDADNNGAIVYTLNAGSNAADLEYFEIQPESGWIVLKKPLDVSVYLPRQLATSAMCERWVSAVWCRALFQSCQGGVPAALGSQLGTSGYSCFFLHFSAPLFQLLRSFQTDQIAPI